MKVKNLQVCTFGELINNYAIDKKIHYYRGATERKIPADIMGYSDPKIRDFISLQTTPRFILQLKNAQVISNPVEKSCKGAVIVSESAMIIKSEYLDHQHMEIEPFLWTARYSDLEISKPQEMVLGRTLYLSALWWHSYYHFHSDVIGKLFVALTYLDKNTIEEFNNIILPSVPKPFMVDMLKKLNLIEKIRIEPLQPIMYENITMPSAAANLDGYWAKDLIDFIRSTFGVNQEQTRKLYISRSDAHHRRVINEADIVRMLIPEGFEIVTLEGMNFSDQISLFSSAKIIVAPHGAALTNLLYCNSSTIVYEFFSTDYVNKCFTELSAEMGLQYFYSVFPGTNDPKMDYRIDLSALKEFLKMVA
jgi:hypothetical protein